MNTVDVGIMFTMMVACSLGGARLTFVFASRWLPALTWSDLAALAGLSSVCGAVVGGALACFYALAVTR